MHDAKIKAPCRMLDFAAIAKLTFLPPFRHEANLNSELGNKTP